MPYYLVKGRFHPGRQEALREWLTSGEIAAMRPFGPSLSGALEQARWEEPTGKAAWEVVCFCPTPLADERPAVLDRFFAELEVQTVARGEGWSQVNHLPRLWAE